MPWLACALIALVAIPAFASGAVLRSSAPAEPTVASAPVAAPTVTFKTTSASLADGTIVVGDNFFHEAGVDHVINAVMDVLMQDFFGRGDTYFNDPEIAWGAGSAAEGGNGFAGGV